MSNWERYEGTTTLAGEDAPVLRGADFKAIVEAGGRYLETSVEARSSNYYVNKLMLLS